MATSQSTINYIIDQLDRLGSRIRSRKMFGEYALYCDEKVVALVCDNQLFLKPTTNNEMLLPTVVYAPPYPGAKMYYLLNDDVIENRELMTNVIEVTCNDLPMSKQKARKKKQS